MKKVKEKFCNIIVAFSSLLTRKNKTEPIKNTGECTGLKNCMSPENIDFIDSKNIAEDPSIWNT